MTDRELVDLFRTDIHSAMEIMVGQYSGLIYKIVYSKLCGLCTKEDAEETVSDIFVLFYRNADKIDLTKGSVKSYLSVMAKRAAIRKAEQLSRGVGNIPLEELENTVSDAEEDISEKERRSQLLDCIKRLGKPDSDIITLKYFYGLKSREIGAKLGLKTNTVDKRISRSLAKLKTMMEEGL